MMIQPILLRTIKKFFSLILLFSVGFSLIPETKLLAQENQENQSICYENIDQAIAKIIERPEYVRANWGIFVKELDNKDFIYQLNSEKYFLPASNTKLMTTAAVLLKYGANYRFQTPIFWDKNNQQLRLIGSGDPSLSNQELDLITQKLQQENINYIEKLVVEENQAQNLGINDTWEWSDLFYYYAVNVNHLILNENTFTLTILPQKLGEEVSLSWSDDIAKNQYNILNKAVTAEKDSPYNISINGILGDATLVIKGEIALNSDQDNWRLAVLKPSQYFLDTFTNILAKNKIKIKQNILKETINQSSDNEQLLMKIDSSPLAELVYKTNQESNNLYAEAFLQLLGKENNNGLAVLKDTLTALGVEPNSYYLQDGSGLSRHNLVSPQALVETLDLMTETPLAEVYENSLPIAGKSGTLKNRFTNTILENNLKAKTGSFSGNYSLSGYLTTQEGENLVFSIMVNNSNQNSTTLKTGMDEIALIFAQIKDCHYLQGRLSF